MKTTVKKVCVMFTCYNRCETTIRCMKSIINTNNNIEFTIIAVDDNSKDGTETVLLEMKETGYNIHILRGDGNLFWCGGMRKAIVYAKNLPAHDYYMLINDDVDFYYGIIEQMIAEMGNDNKILVGATCDSNGNYSYGGVRYIGRGIKYKKVELASKEVCHTFNANCVLIPKSIFMEAGNIDEMYIHTLGDFDLGLSLYRKGYEIKMFSKYVGVCNPNSIEGTWWDKSLSIKERVRKKEQPKGAPFKQWFYFLKKNFGLKKALIHGFTPYVRIIIKR